MSSRFVETEGLRIAVRDEGEGTPVLLLHGWPTSSHLWRHVVPPLAEKHRVLALDLPGFGQSDKPLDASYSFRFFDRVLDGALEQLGVDSVGLAVHDLGGPVGLHWAVQRWDRIEGLALLNTLVYPTPSWAVVAFVVASYAPGLRSYLTSQVGLKHALQIGVGDPSNVSAEGIEGFQAPFRTRAARKALLKAAHGLHPGGMQTIARRLREYEGPVRIIYGAKDRILPDVDKTMKRVASELPQAQTTCFHECGHFLQEERGADIGRLLAEFFVER